jgi:hypothetical protein
LKITNPGKAAIHLKLYCGIFSPADQSIFNLGQQEFTIENASKFTLRRFQKFIER